MEVHHHSHIHKQEEHNETARAGQHAPKKVKWTHYLWEFLMLFLAVFCGFMAENQREHMVENQRGRQYIYSMVVDLQTDTANLTSIIDSYLRRGVLFDSLIAGFSEGIRSYSPWSQKFLRSYRGGFPDFYGTDRTIDQLKNAGGLRLIKNQKAAAGIIAYDAAVKDVVNEQTGMANAHLRYIEEVLKVWSVRRLYQDNGVTNWYMNRQTMTKDNYWLTKDPLAFEYLYNNMAEYNEAIIRQTRWYRELKVTAVSLIELLKKEYNIK